MYNETIDGVGISEDLDIEPWKKHKSWLWKMNRSCISSSSVHWSLLSS